MGCLLDVTDSGTGAFPAVRAKMGAQTGARIGRHSWSDTIGPLPYPPCLDLVQATLQRRAIHERGDLHLMPETSGEPGPEPQPVSTGYSPDGRMRAHASRPPGTIARLGYLTPQDQFGDVERGN